MWSGNTLGRRKFLAGLAKLSAAGISISLLPSSLANSTSSYHYKTIPATNEAIPAIGMGTWVTFNVGNNKRALERSTQIVSTFLKAGGKVIDSSPMYGSAEKTIGFTLAQLNAHNQLFSATKVWTPFKSTGDNQFEESQKLWRLQKFDLLQIHNLLGWQKHLPQLISLKEQGVIRYIGVTTSHGRRHGELAQIMKSQPIDFIQLTYNILDREAEQYLLPLAKDKGIAVIANRPFQRGALIDRFSRLPLPNWAADIQCESWPQFLLKFIISHPAITCAIPATSQVSHMTENMAAMQGRLPDAKLRQQMAAYIGTL